MKIISKFKDYYDYLAGKYGIDDKVVYERTSRDDTGKDKYFLDGEWKPGILGFGTLELFYVAVCGMKFTCFRWDGNYFFGSEARAKAMEFLGNASYVNGVHRSECEKIPAFKNFVLPEGIMAEFEPTDVNERLDVPILLSKSPDFRKWGTYKNVNLSLVKFGKAVDAEKMWCLLYNWLSREKEIKDGRTDMMKIQGHGFDERSFRNTGNRLSGKNKRRN